ncbi:MAG: 3-deoxy-D-manno-octulosonic acid transferase [Bacteroidia bacterium]|nr:3-deoxy-D-manno-octulosonic acid transferase [Bacteroidia bacterium]
MMRWLYTIGIRLYGFAVWFAAHYNRKAADWMAGRQHWKTTLASEVNTPGPPWVWVHCASLGEFEQGRNLIDHLYDHHPEFRVLVTFFSPSGYQIRSKYAKAHHVAYLPLDTPANARAFLNLVSPAFGIFIKYELWLNLLREAARLSLPLILVAARPHPDKPALRWPLRSLFVEGYRSFQHIFTQDEESRLLLESLGHPSVSVSADTRFDRVAANRRQWQALPEIERFLGGRSCLVAGSTWPKDEELLLAAWAKLPDHVRPRLIIAPHEIHPERMEARIAAFPQRELCYGEISQAQETHEILWIDRIGLLSRLYAYGKVAYVGGAFDKGLHNILEAAVFGCSLIIGPAYQRFPEAIDLVSEGACTSVKNEAEFLLALETRLLNFELLENHSRITEAYVAQREGATKKILTWMMQQNWLS